MHRRKQDKGEKDEDRTKSKKQTKNHEKVSFLQHSINSSFL